MSTGRPCQRWEDGQKALPCMSYLGPGAEHNSVHSGPWMKLLIQWRGFPLSVGRCATKGAWTHRLCRVVLEDRLIHTKAKTCHTKEGCFNLNVLLHKKAVFFSWSNQNKEVTLHVMILKLTIGGRRNSPFLFLTVLWGVVFGPGLGPQAGALSLLC